MIGILLCFILSSLSVSQSLQCYSCNIRYQKRACMDNVTLIRPSYKNCTKEETYCLVERFEVNGELQKFVRGCSRQCKPECAGHYKGKLKFTGTGLCITCCQHDLCNASDLISKPLLLPFTVLAMISSLVASAASGSS